MNNANLILSLFAVASLFAACTSDNEVETKVEITSAKKVAYNIDASTPLFSYCLKYHDGLLYYLNREQSNIMVFDEEKLIHKIQIDTEGSNGIGRITGFSINKKGELLVSSSGKPLIYVLGKDGSIIKKVDYSEAMGFAQVASYVSLSSKYRRDIFEIDNKYYIPQDFYSQGKPEEAFQKSQDFKVALVHDKETNTTQFTDFEFPKDYFKEGYFLTYPSMTFNGKDLILALRSSHDIQVYDIQTGKIKSYKVKSSLIDEIKPIKSYGIAEMNEYVVLGNSYESIVYNQFKNHYYRIARLMPKDEEKIKNDVRHYKDFPDRISIMVLDEDFNILAEKELNGDLYNIYNFYVTEEGLHLSLNNPLNPEYDENKLLFEVFTLQ